MLHTINYSAGLNVSAVSFMRKLLICPDIQPNDSIGY